MGELIELVKSAPKIIAEAAKSPLGIVALIILALSVLALIFFRSAPDVVKLGVFVLLLGSAVAFVYSGVNTELSYRKYWRQATEAIDREDYQSGLRKLEDALLILTNEDSKRLSQDQVSARRYFILTTRSLWRAFSEKRAQGEVLLRENTGKHLGEAFDAWRRIPPGVLPAAEITESQMVNVVRYMCSPEVEEYLLPVDVTARTEVCRRVELDRPLLLADEHLKKPPLDVAAPRGQSRESGSEEKLKEDTLGKTVPEKQHRETAPKEERREPGKKK